VKPVNITIACHMGYSRIFFSLKKREEKFFFPISINIMTFLLFESFSPSPEVFALLMIRSKRRKLRKPAIKAEKIYTVRPRENEYFAFVFSSVNKYSLSQENQFYKLTKRVLANCFVEINS
jgi:hypothetical protein